MKNLQLSTSEITDNFKDLKLHARKYINFHKYRYQYLLENIHQLAQTHTGNTPVKLLDIGPAYQTFLIRKYFPNFKVDTLGFNNPANNLRSNEVHYTCNLNRVNQQWDENIKNYDIIVFCEVLEHLYSKPEKCLKKFQSALANSGSIIIQTPNAVAIHKRLKMLVGYNPYSLLHEDEMGHFREYTVQELREMMKSVHLHVDKISLKNYFNNDSTFLNRAYVKSEAFMPPSFRDGITLIASKL